MILLRLLTPLVFLAASAGLFLGPQSADAQEVGIVAITDHPALLAARDGIADALVDAGREAPVWSSAGGDPAAVTALVEAWSDQGAGVIIALASPTVVAALAATGDTPPILGAAVGREVLSEPGLSGAVTDGVPLTGLVEAIAAIHPGAGLGILVPTDQTAWGTAVSAAASASGLTVTLRPVASLPDVLVSVSQLARTEQAIMVPGGALADQAIDAVVAIGDGAATPVYTDDAELLARGASGTVVIDYYDLGRVAGAMALDILAGGSGEVVAAPGSLVLLNGPKADRLGLSIPESLVGRVERVSP